MDYLPLIPYHIYDFNNKIILNNGIKKKNKPMSNKNKFTNNENIFAINKNDLKDAKTDLINNKNSLKKDKSPSVDKFSDIFYTKRLFKFNKYVVRHINRLYYNYDYNKIELLTPYRVRNVYKIPIHNEQDEINFHNILIKSYLLEKKNFRFQTK